MRKRLTNSSALLAAAIVATGVFVASRPPREPPFEGRPLRFWIEQQAAGDRRKEEAARLAIQAIGSNAVPHLVDLLSAKESRFTPRLVELARRVPFVQVRHTPLRERQRLAAKACEAIGRPVRGTVPALARLLTTPELAEAVAGALGEMGPVAIPCLAAAAHHTNDTVRFYAAHALGLARGVTAASAPSRPE